MLFSIVIPTYNPLKLIKPLMDSIMTNDCLDEIEVILSDDKSEEKIETLGELYPKCNIVLIENDQHYGFSRPGRQRGMQCAQGEWICFADQDDYFCEHIFDMLKTYIAEEKVENYITTNLYHKLMNGKIEVQNFPWSMTHGKFYEKKFIEKYNIKYPEVQYCEDMNFQSQLECILTNNEIKANRYPITTYVWVDREGSTSFQDSDFFYKSFPDYIRAELCNYVEEYIKTSNLSQDAEQFYIDTFIHELMEVYFEFQWLLMKTLEFPPATKEFYALVYDALTKFLNRADFTMDSFFDYIEEGYVRMYNELYIAIVNQNSVILPKESLFDWIRNLEKRSI